MLALLPRLRLWGRFPAHRRAVLAAASASKRLSACRSVTVVLLIDQFLRAAGPPVWWPSSSASIILVMCARGLLDGGCQPVDRARNREKPIDDVCRLAIAVRLVRNCLKITFTITLLIQIFGAIV